MRKLLSFVFLISYSFDVFAVINEPWSEEKFIRFSHRERRYHLGLDPQLSEDVLKEFEKYGQKNNSATIIPSLFWTPEQKTTYKLNGIPTVTYFPKDYGTEGDRKLYPLIVRSHGGPSVTEKWSDPRAETAYFLSHGFIILCPDYRGSAGHGDAYENSIRENIYAGVEDIYSVGHYAKHSIKQVDPDRIFLTGLCFGSLVNTLLASKLGKEGFPDTRMFTRIHLISGLYDLSAQKEEDRLLKSSDYLYLTRSGSPEDWHEVDVQIPYLRSEWSPLQLVHELPLHVSFSVAHGLRDGTAPFNPALKFMETLFERGYDAQFHVSQKGGHWINREDLKENPPKDEDFESYLRKWSKFFLAPSALNLISKEESKKELEKARTFLKMHEDKKKHEAKLAKEVAAQTPVLDTSSILVAGDTSDLPPPSTSTQSSIFLKSILKDRFNPQNLEGNINQFLDDHYFNISAYSSYRDDKDFRKFVKKLFLNEETLLQKNQGHYALYHGANGGIGFIYLVYSLWGNILTQDPSLKFRLRPCDAIFSDFQNMEEFLASMLIEHRLEGITRDSKSLSDVETIHLNHTRKFMESVLSGNLFITGGYLQEGCNSLDFFWRNKPPAKVINFTDMLKGPYSMLGIYRPEQIKRYEALATEVNDNSVLLQMVVSEAYPAYVSDLGGAPVGNTLLSPSQLVRELENNLEGTEKSLKEKRSFLPKAIGQREGRFINDLELIQVRALAQPKPNDPQQKRVIIPYFKRPYPSEFLHKLKDLVLDDVRFLLAMRTYILPSFFGSETLSLVEKYQERLRSAFKKPANKDLMARITPQQIHAYIRNGNLNGVCKYFKERSEFTNSYIFSYKNGFQLAALEGQTNLLKWFYEKFPSSTRENTLIEVLGNSLLEGNKRASTTILRSGYMSSAILKKTGEIFYRDDPDIPADLSFDGSLLNVLIPGSNTPTEILRALIETKIDINYVWKVNGYAFTPLHEAIHEKRKEVVIQLLAAGADSSIPYLYNSGISMDTLEFAKINGTPEIYDLIKNHINQLTNNVL